MQRALDLGKIPKPPFPYTQFFNWRAAHKDQKFFIEIGCGVGWHPIQWALTHPDATLLAIERTTNKFKKFQSRLEHHKPLPNLWATHANANQLLPHLNLLNSVDGIFILYPNPEPKSHQQSRRWAHQKFMQYLVALLKPHGQITFATNMNSYANELRQELPHRYPLVLVEDRNLDRQAPPRTHFEKKYLERGEICTNLIFKNTGLKSISDASLRQQ